METKAKLKNVTRDWLTKKFQLTFEVEGDVTNALDDITGKILRLTAKQWKERRSLDSNAYMWLLTSKIAQATGSSREFEHKRQLLEFGILDSVEGSPIVITLHKKVDIDLVDGYWKFYKASSDGCFNSYMRIKPTHEYDSREMSDFLEHVVEEAKELGIETATPEELERMAQLYEQNSKRNSR